MTGVVLAVVTCTAVLLVMLGEAGLSAHNERVLRAQGAVEPPGDVFRIMRWAYPASFVIVALEGAIAGPPSHNVLAAGLALFGASKALKVWAISSLGVRWTFRVLVLPGTPLVRRGPYAFLRHPNYIAVIGELVSVALIVWAPFTGVAAVIAFGALILRRIAVEDRALGRE
jgi:methyltransferase